MAVEDPEPVFPWWDFLERELALAKERDARMERIKARVRDRGPGGPTAEAEGQKMAKATESV